jgi:protein-disulfide isomerase
MSKRFWLIILIIIVVFGGALVLTGKHNNSGSSKGTPSSHVEGQGKDNVRLIEYGDYECPFCEEYYPVVKQVAAQYNDQITFQFRNLPLTQIHPNAFAGARAAEAAALQGKFWQMHDMLYEEQSQWVNSSNPLNVFEGYASSLGLSTTQFDSDYASNKVNSTIQADISAFAKTGLPEATPSFLLNGKHITPNPSVSSFEQLINNAIKQKTTKP